MPFCTNCGAKLDDTMRFCPSCGQPVAANIETVAPVQQTVVTPVQTIVTPVVTEPIGEYRLVLVSRGNCTKAAAKELLSDVLDYTKVTVDQFLNIMPVEIAHNLTAEQALCLCQLLTEYDMQVAVYCGSNYVDISSYAHASVFASNGTLLIKVAKVLETLGAAHRMTTFTRWSLGDAIRFAFAPRYTRIRTSPYISGLYRRAPKPVPPRPAVRRPAPVPPRPAPVRPAPLRPAPVRPSPARPAPGRPAAPKAPGRPGPRGGGRGPK